MKRLLLKHTFIILHMLVIGGIAAALSWILSVSWTDAAVFALIAAHSTSVIENWEKKDD